MKRQDRATCYQTQKFKNKIGKQMSEILRIKVGVKKKKKNKKFEKFSEYNSKVFRSERKTLKKPKQTRQQKYFTVQAISTKNSININLRLGFKRVDYGFKRVN